MPGLFGRCLVREGGRERERERERGRWRDRGGREGGGREIERNLLKEAIA